MADTARYSNAVLRHPHLVFCSVAHDPFEVDVLLFQLIKLGAYRMDCKKMSYRALFTKVERSVIVLDVVHCSDDFVNEKLVFPCQLRCSNGWQCYIPY